MANCKFRVYITHDMRNTKRKRKIPRLIFESDRSTTTKELTGTRIKIPGCFSFETG